MACQAHPLPTGSASKRTNQRKQSWLLTHVAYQRVQQVAMVVTVGHRIKFPPKKVHFQRQLTSATKQPLTKSLYYYYYFLELELYSEEELVKAQLFKFECVTEMIDFITSTVLKFSLNA